MPGTAVRNTHGVLNDIRDIFDRHVSTQASPLASFIKVPLVRDDN